MENPEIRKELLGRDSAWIAERIAKADALNAELLEALEFLVGEDGDLFSDEAHSKAHEAIRKATGE